MSDIVLVLGPIAFADFEIPERIRFGGNQRLAVHQLPGGRRVVDALGRDDGEICWSGVFTARMPRRAPVCWTRCACRADRCR